jgi:hypothetical protein
MKKNIVIIIFTFLISGCEQDFQIKDYENKNVSRQYQHNVVERENKARKIINNSSRIDRPVDNSTMQKIKVDSNTYNMMRK